MAKQPKLTAEQLARPCTCSHPIGRHVADSPHRCGDCSCQEFRRSA